MTKQEFREFIKDRIILLDGATGSNLQKRGMPAGVCPELWICEHGEVLQELQREYIDAGSNIVYAPTFGANRLKLKEYDLADRVEEINTRLVQISREAAAGRALVAGDVTMTGQQLEPLGDLTFGELYEVYKEQIRILAEAGADLIVVETMMSLSETRAALLAAKDASPDLPVIATMSFTESGNTLYGTSAESAAVVLQGLGADAVGLNCSAGPDKMLGVLRRMAAVAHIPLIAKPNAGLPQMNAAGETVYDMEAEAFAAHMKDMLEAGARIAGGCCGTTPAYIAGLAAVAAEKTASAGAQMAAAEETAQNGGQIFLADERQIYPFEAGQMLDLGDGIDFTKDAELRNEYADGAFDTALDTAFDLQDDEADALLFCADGLEGEAEILKEAIAEVTQSVRMPVVIATKDPAAAQRVLAEYAGIAGVLCTSEDSARKREMEAVLRRYSAPAVTIDKQIVCC